MAALRAPVAESIEVVRVRASRRRVETFADAPIESAKVLAQAEDCHT